ncbi:MAG: type II secretion system GspH family protein [Ruminococcus sp.]|nr:type II secretion system GspH family protein [Ruminococcus sp.]
MNKKVKGFTLIELIVVIAIIGVLTGILVPSFATWTAKSKIRKQNNNARVIFNSAQTIVQEYKFRERRLEDTQKCIGNGDFYYYWDKESGASVSGTAVNVGDAEFLSDFTRQLNRLYDDSGETTYRIYVNNYMVQSVVASSGNTNSQKGSYPTRQEHRNNTTVQNFDMDSIKLTP